MKFKSSYLIALIIVIVLAVWVATGSVEIGGAADETNIAPPIAEREHKDYSGPFQVRIAELGAESHARFLQIRGRTKADAIVTIRSQTAGTLEKRLVNRGDFVEKGQTVCLLDKGTRQSRIKQTKAQLVQATADYESARKLRKKGFTAKNTLAKFEAALESARSAVDAANEELERTEIIADATGIVQDPIAEPGDTLSIGNACVTLMDNDPMLFSGQVSEADIDKLQLDMKADLRLASGGTASGKLRYIAPMADPQTRTFAVEIAIDNSEAIRDGMTAEAEINLTPVPAMRILPSWISLDDDGTIGIKIIDDENRVIFKPVEILSQGNNGFWINAVEAPQKDKPLRLITLGQEYVIDGVVVDPQPDTRLAQTGNKAQAQ